PDQIFDRGHENSVAEQGEGLSGSRQVLVAFGPRWRSKKVDPADVGRQREGVAGPESLVVDGEWQVGIDATERCVDLANGCAQPAQAVRVTRVADVDVLGDQRGAVRHRGKSADHHIADLVPTEQPDHVLRLEVRTWTHGPRRYRRGDSLRLRWQIECALPVNAPRQPGS